MSDLIYYAVERSFCEYVGANLGTQSGEVLVFEFPVSELGGSHTYSIEFISDTPIPIAGHSIDGGSKGRFIESLAQIDVFRLPTSSGEPDVAGAKKMVSRVDSLFKGTHFIPFKTYGSAPTASTTGTVAGALQVDLTEVSKTAFDPNQNLRRYTQTIKIKVKEAF